MQMWPSANKYAKLNNSFSHSLCIDSSLKKTCSGQKLPPRHHRLCGRRELILAEANDSPPAHCAVRNPVHVSGMGFLLGIRSTVPA